MKLKELKEIMAFDIEQLIENAIATGGQVTNIRFIEKNHTNEV